MNQSVLLGLPPENQSLALLFSGWDVSIESTQNQSCLQKTPKLNRKVNYFASQRQIIFFNWLSVNWNSSLRTIAYQQLVCPAKHSH